MQNILVTVKCEKILVPLSWKQKDKLIMIFVFMRKLLSEKNKNNLILIPWNLAIYHRHMQPDSKIQD